MDGLAHANHSAKCSREYWRICRLRDSEYNYNEGQSSHIPLDVHASVCNTDGQVRNSLSDMEPIDTNDQVRNTDNQRVVNFLAVGQEWEANHIGRFLQEKKVPPW